VIIYLDLDGVFADFKTRFREIIKFEYETNPDQAWGVLDKQDHLFRNLPVLPGSKQMFDAIAQRAWRGYEIKFLTALPRLTGKLKTAAQDKHDWVREHLSPTAEVICTDGWRGKRAYAKPDAILIDDMQRNIDDWRDGGGIGIRHTSVEDTLIQLSEYI
jgi:5'(3')-deoxyribonucleotidase